ncbi:A disintegrin and metalloproteinase with thrombospondin motifs 17-like [Sycon ciliatum]|uniref:A disintegrin and metalloproteinase with thrombospondin motifs 17-like n=1 Tax=Sycon ciliatum TaxID=27933 RepID=UPI0031F60923
MFSDHSVIELMGAEGNVTHRQPIMAPTHCYYRGHITGANDSLVAFSTCKGMTGAIFSPDDAFFIHPLPPYLLNHSANAHSHTHMVVRRSVDSDTSGPGDRKHCGVGLRKNPAGYREAQYNYIPFYAAMDEVRSKFNPKRKNVYSQYGPMYIETALVVDTYMYEQHDRDQDALKTYLLTLMNLMQAVFSPESTGLDITLHVTRIIYLTDHQPNMPIGHDSVALLDKFGTFQQRLNPVQDSNFIHHDFAMLLTGFDLCAADNRAGCGELGRAYIQSLCSPTTSAAVVRDRGIQNAVVMAHELGHVLGAYHDSSVCSPDEGYVMVGSATNTKKFWQFSDCSKAYFRSFLGTDETQCILDCPLQHHSLVVHDYMLPGQRYSREQQCQFQFPNHTFCSRFRPDEMCQTLYCDQGDRLRGCWTTYQPALDGTECAPGKVCYHNECVDLETLEVPRRPELLACQRLSGNSNIRARQRQALVHTKRTRQPVAGGWTDWTEWSDCTLTCGDGYSQRRRECDNPEPANGGADCEGRSVDIRKCIRRPCTQNANSIIAQPVRDAEDVCTRLSTAETGHLVPFIPVNSTDHSSCRVLCLNAAEPSSRPLDVSVSLPDGADCKHPVDGGFVDGKCLDGTCTLDFGCDGNLDSGYQRDACYTCGGSGGCCKVYHKTVEPTARNRRGLHQLVKIPVSADNVIIRQKHYSELFMLSISSGDTYFMNEDDYRRKKFVHVAIPPRKNAVLTYHRPHDSPDVATVLGRLYTALTVYSFKRSGEGSSVDPGVEVSYTVGVPNACTDVYYWRENYSPCSTTCGTGTRVVYITCNRRIDGRAVDSRQCRRYRLRGEKRNATESCQSSQECTSSSAYEWRRYSWDTCSRPCGGGEQRRDVRCFDKSTGKRVADSSLCTDERPSGLRQCNHVLCAEGRLVWINKRWSPCSATCGQGVQVRAVVCRQYVGGQPFNVPPYVCQKAKIGTQLPLYRSCTVERRCSGGSSRRPRVCKDTSPLCKVVRAGRGCSKPGMRDLCCDSCV